MNISRKIIEVVQRELARMASLKNVHPCTFFSFLKMQQLREYQFSKTVAFVRGTCTRQSARFAAGQTRRVFSRANAYTINTTTAASPRITAISWAGDGNQTCKDDKNIIAVNLWPVRCKQGKDCFWRGHQLQFRSRFGYFRRWSSKRHISYLYCKLKREPLKTSVLRGFP